MAVNLSPIGGVAAQFLDNSGNPLTGGKIYTYTAGTTTPQVTYTSSNGATAHSNPIILDAAGRVPSGEIWLTDGLQYKFLIKTSTDVQIGSYDNIVGINSNFVNYTSSQEFQTATAGQTVFTLTTMQYQPGTNSLSVFVDGVNQYGPGALYAYQETSSTVVTFTSGLHVGADVKFTTTAINSSAATDAEQVGYIPPFTGGVPTNVELKLAQTVSAKDFGAVGNGIDDDTTKLQSFIDACQDGRGYIPPGIYKITAPLIVQPQYSYNIEGACYDNAGIAGTVIYNAGTGNAIELDNEPYTPPNFDSEIRFAHLVVNGNAASQNGFFIRHAMIHLEYVWCRGHGTNGIWLERGFASSFRQVVCANNNENGMFVRIAGNALHIDHCVFNGNGGTVSGSAGLYLTGQDPDGYDFGVVATACDFTGNGTSVAIGYGVIAQYCRGVSFIGCYGELNKSYNLYADTTTKNLTVTGCYWQDADVYAVDVNGLIYENNHHNRVSTPTNVRISVGLPGGKYENRIFGNTYNGGAVEVFTNGASSNVAIHYSQPPTGGTWKRGDTVWNNNVQNGGGLLGWVCITPGTPGTWLQIGQIPYVFTNWGDSDATLTVGASFTTNIWQSALTVNRTVTLSSTGAYSGAKFRITRAAGATGVSTLDVGGLKSLAVSQWCDVEYTGANWIVTAFGSL